MVEPARFIVVMACDKAKEGSFVPGGACLRGNAAMFKDGYRLFTASTSAVSSAIIQSLT